MHFGYVFTKEALQGDAGVEVSPLVLAPRTHRAPCEPPALEQGAEGSQSGCDSSRKSNPALALPRIGAGGAVRAGAAGRRHPRRRRGGAAHVAPRCPGTPPCLHRRMPAPAAELPPRCLAQLFYCCKYHHPRLDSPCPAAAALRRAAQARHPVRGRGGGSGHPYGAPHRALAGLAGRALCWCSHPLYWCMLG